MNANVNGGTNGVGVVERKIIIDKAKVHELMNRAGISSVAQLARIADVHRNTLDNCLAGENFTSETLRRLSVALKCNPTDLLTYTGSPVESFSLAPVSH